MLTPGPVMTRALKIYKSQRISEAQEVFRFCLKLFCPHKPTSKDKKGETSIRRMLDAIAAHGMFHNHDENRGLWNFLEERKQVVSKPMTTSVQKHCRNTIINVV